MLLKIFIFRNNYCPICFAEWQYNKKPVEDPYTTLVDKMIIGNDEAQSIINDAQSIIDKYKNNAKDNKTFESTLTDIKKMWSNNEHMKSGTGTGYWAIHYNEEENGILKIEEKKFSSGPSGFSKKNLTQNSGPEIKSGTGTHKCDCVTCTKSININEYIKEKISNKLKTINIDL